MSRLSASACGHLVLALFLFGWIGAPVVRASDSAASARKDSETLTEAREKFADETFGSKDARDLENLLDSADSAVRFGATRLLAIHRIENDERYADALLILAPLILKEGAATRWRNEWMAASKRAARMRREPPPFDTVPFPPVAEWVVTDTTGGAVLEAARCLMKNGREMEALDAIDRVGRMEGGWQVEAAEYGGDLLFGQRLFDRAMAMYRQARRMLAWLKSPSAPWTPLQRAQHARLGEKLAHAKRALETERYGEGWVFYRDAEEARLTAKDPSLAILRYRRVLHSDPESVYAEASAAYMTICLLELATESGRIKIRLKTEEIETKLKKLREAHRKLRMDLPSSTKRRREEQIRELSEDLRHLRDLPTGAAAEKQATCRIQELLDRQGFGLYRGELLLARADFHLDEKLNPESARSAYEEARLWIEAAEKAKEKLDAFTIPGAALEVASPPIQPHGTDGWGNVEQSKIEPGHVVNRRTCSWYLDSLRARACAGLAFLAFVNDEIPAAREWCRRMNLSDARSRHLGGMGIGNIYSRLIHGLDCKAFRNALDEEMAAFKNPQRRFVVMLADFHADCERPEEAETLYRALFEKRYGRLSNNEEAYVRFQLGWVSWYRGIDRLDQKLQDAAVEWFLPFQTDAALRRSPTAPRAVFSLYNTMRYSPDPIRREAAYAVLKVFPDDFPDFPRAQTALYTLAYRAKTYGGKKGGQEALGYLRRLLKDYPKTQWRKLSEEMIGEIEAKEAPKS